MLGHRPLVIEDYFAILKRRGWMIIIPALLLPIIAVAITYKITPIYTSQTLVLIEPQTVPDTYVKPIIEQDLDSRLASMKEQILSRSRLEPIIERFNLGTPGMDMDDKVVSTRKNIGITPIHSEIQGAGGLPGFFISFTASDPHTAQLVCREITSLFVSENLQAREQSAEGTTAFIKGQLEQAKANLDQQDQKLAEFQKQYMGTLPEQQAPNMEMLNTLNTQLDATTQTLTRMESEKTLVESMLAQESRQSPAAPGMRSTPQADTLELQRLEDKEADLKARYTPDYPDVIAVQRQIDDLKKQMAVAAAPAASSAATPAAPHYDTPGTMQLRAQVTAMTQAIAQKKQQQGELQAQIRQYQGKIQSTPLVEAKMKDLTRDHDQAQEFYNSLLGKMNNSQMATDLERRQEGENFKIMDDANLPDAPTFPNRSMFAIGGLVLGLGFGVLLIAFLEFKDKSLRTERDVWTFTKLPTLATIALIHETKGKGKGSLKNLLKDDAPAANKSLANVGS
ncbi:GNVR domain-containing protein [Granulicella sp. L46]|uniref:GumC family protein n=1 Tax=Granulicella sp. L46 TaxID=1641865 RepID=UPI00131D67B9|nr:GNVR domain-containing protein [Granulicella sp. L46]